VRFNQEARQRYMAFAGSSEAVWAGNFRDLSASVTRMATLAEAGRITDDIAEAEIKRLKRLWQHHMQAADTQEVDLARIMGSEAAAQLDLFDAMQLQAVIGLCRRCRSMSDAGRKLYAVSRDAKAKPNDADRLKKYLAKFGLDWDTVSSSV
jgi:transcriptional regulatory protein RtcR